MSPHPDKPCSSFTALGAFWAGDSALLLERSLLSINSNSLLPLEIILVQDGDVSSDLLAVVESYCGDAPLRLISLSDNRGLGHALNLGLQSVTTDFVIRFDADDYSLPSRFESIMGALNDGYDLVGSQALEDNGPGFRNTERRVPLEGSKIRSYLRYRSPFNHMTVGFKVAAVMGAQGYPDIRLREDYGLWARLIASGSRVCNIDKVLVEASAGDGLIRRRGGWRHVIAEIKLQKLMISLGTQSYTSAALIGTLRCTIFLLPVFLRRFIYLATLRRSESGDSAGIATPPKQSLVGAAATHLKRLFSSVH
ncbi:MAG: glycosyltransferase [Proteobacteria bacterium]|nr:glycosyltransferase [Pseudomonadota bacterium]